MTNTPWVTPWHFSILNENLDIEGQIHNYPQKSSGSNNTASISMFWSWSQLIINWIAECQLLLLLVLQCKCSSLTGIWGFANYPQCKRSWSNTCHKQPRVDFNCPRFWTFMMVGEELPEVKTYKWSKFWELYHQNRRVIQVLVILLVMFLRWIFNIVVIMSLQDLTWQITEIWITLSLLIVQISDLVHV